MQTFTLPDADAMRTRLASTEVTRAVGPLHPWLLAEAGAETTGAGLATLLTLAVADASGGLAPVARMLTYSLPNVVEVLVDDAQGRADALTALRGGRPA